MNITIIGTGYVGLVAGVGYAKLGHHVTCVDIDPRKVQMINDGKSPIFETGLEVLEALVKEKKLVSTTSYDSVASSDCVLISVGTPEKANGDADLSFVFKSAESVGAQLKSAKHFVTVIVRSTVPPGTSDEVASILEKTSGKKAGKDFGVAMVPEFLREGVALSDFLNPDRMVFGTNDAQSKATLEKLHEKFSAPKIWVSRRTAEMTKYASNNMLLSRIMFVYELGLLCEKMGVDVKDVAQAMGMDSRIGKKFLEIGPGAGGSCFPKDVSALIRIFEKEGIDPIYLRAVQERNKKQPLHVLELAGDVKGKTVAVLGLSFKANTDDVRESASIPLIKGLLAKGAKVRARDPQGMENMKKIFADVEYSNSFEDALRGADACIIMTEWAEFKRPAKEYKALTKGTLVVDGRRLLEPSDAKAEGLQYKAVGLGELT